MADLLLDYLAQLELQASDRVFQLTGADPSITNNLAPLAYEPLPTDDPRILRVLKLAPGSGSDPLSGTLELVPGVGESDETRPPNERLRELGADQSMAEAVQAAREAKAKDSGDNPPLRPTVDYEALSYVWGDAAKTRSMTLNGVLIGITANLASALYRLRQQNSDRTLWVDALCINQADDVEKRREVMRMRAIYYSAQCVVVDLGPPQWDTNVAIDFAEEMHTLFCSYLTRLGVQDEGEGIFDWIREPQLYQMTLDFKLTVLRRHDDWKALHRFLSRPWFQRAWTLQELVVSRSSLLLCGIRTVKWEVIELAIRIASATYQDTHQLLNVNFSFLFRDNPGSYTFTPYTWSPYHLDYLTALADARSRYRFLDVRNITGGLGAPGNMFRAEAASSRLTLTMTRNCTLAHDKIYSVLGVLPPPLRDAIQKDMDYSIPAREVFLRAVKACVETTKWLNIICHSHYGPWYPDGHPSWLPDWTRIPRSSIFAERNRDAVFPPHRVTMDQPAETSFSADLRTLTARGFVIGKVSKVGIENELLGPVERVSRYKAAGEAWKVQRWRDATYPKDPEFQYIPNVRGDADGHESDPNFFDFEEPLRKLVGARLLCQRPSGNGDVLDRFLDGLDGAAGRLSDSSDEDDTELLAVPKDKEDEFMGCYAKVRGHMMSRTIFARGEGEYGQGLLGIGPDFTCRGDVLCILLGCDAPVLLREKDGEEGKFRFVGETHMQGFMDGEGMEGVDEGVYKLVDFAIV